MTESSKKTKTAFLRLFTITVFIILASIDNSVLDMASSVYKFIKPALHTSDFFLGVVNAVLIWIVASVAIWWGYLGDKGNRKRLLLIGTLIWSSSLIFTPLVTNEVSWVIVQCVAGFGLACIASVGFSVIVDFVSPEKRGTALGLWGLSQGIGTGLGKALAAVTVTSEANWWVPFVVFSIAGFVMIFLYFFTLDPKRGATEKELEGIDYDYRIKKGDLAVIFKKRTNILLMLTGVIGQIGWGALTWLPTAFANILVNQGLSDASSNLAGNVVAGLLAIGGIFSIIFGAFSDKLQRRTLKARPLVSGVSSLLGVPFFIGMVLIPFDLSAIAGVEGTIPVVMAMISQLGANLPFLGMLLMSIGAAALMSAQSPNWFAMIGDVNLPEHRGTMFGFGNFINGLGRGIGSILVPIIAAALAGIVSEARSLIWGIAICMFAFIPMGLISFAFFKTVEPDYRHIKEILTQRAIELKSRSTNE